MCYCGGNLTFGQEFYNSVKNIAILNATIDVNILKLMILFKVKHCVPWSLLDSFNLVLVTFAHF